MSKHRKSKHNDDNHKRLSKSHKERNHHSCSEEISHTKGTIIKSNCLFEGVKPAMTDNSCPPIQVQSKNEEYAHLLSSDFCGEVSEFTAIAQYINHELRFSAKHCNYAKTLLSISKAEMIHLQMLGQLIELLGGSVDYTSKSSCDSIVWTSKFIDYGNSFEDMIRADILAEKEAITQYKSHIEEIDDIYVTAVLERIIEDETYHIKLLRSILNKL